MISVADNFEYRGNSIRHIWDKKEAYRKCIGDMFAVLRKFDVYADGDTSVEVLMERKLAELRDENAKLRAERDALAAKLGEKLAEYMLAFPVCAAHAPMGGARSGCPVCERDQLAQAVADAEVALGEMSFWRNVEQDNPAALAALERFRSRNKEAT